MDAEADSALARLGALTGTGQLGEDRTELTLHDGGQWLVLSLSSAHFFDLDAMLVARIPGHHAMEMITDRGSGLRSLDRCRIGEFGMWTMEALPHEHNIEYRWHRSTEIRRIARVIGLERMPGVAPAAR